MKTKLFFNKMLAILLAISILATLVTGLTVSAASTTDTRVVDKSTMDDWKNYFGTDVKNTENAGGVWGDKSVFKDAAAFSSYGITMDDANNNFLIALSAIASNKSIVGYSAIPTDTMLVLDLSNSMSNDAMENMVSATNAAIRKLLALNLNNRVGVVLYSGVNQTNSTATLGDAIVLLPLDRYTGVGDEGEEEFVSYSNRVVSVMSGVLDLNPGQRTPSKSASGSTYIQAGVQLAWNEFDAVTDTVITSGPQTGTKRMPVMVLMSDGAPTYATTSFNAVGNSTHGNGGSTSATNSFLTQLSCAWARAKMVEKYDRSGLFYTLGLNVENDNNAKAVLDPANSYNTLTGWWNSYLSATANSNVSFSTGGRGSRSFTVKKDAAVTEMNYVDSYFSASNEAGLINAFERIVDQIIIQSKYYPTLVENGNHNLDGYITFTDELGEYMEVKSIKGLTVHGDLYEGYRIAEAIAEGHFGDISTGDLSQLNADGHEFLKAVEKRLGCTEDQAITVVTQALRTGQLNYTDNDNFSNYIGWYADADGNYLGFWDGGSTANKPTGAVYVNKSYGFMGEVGSAEEYNLTDMLYISVQVHQNIENGHQMVIYKIPASLVPMVSYNISFEGDNLETGSNFKMSIDGAEEPLRLLFEVGLRSDINRININDKIDTHYQYKSADGYTFYTNSWHPHTHTSDHIVDTHDATFLDFKPSLENERYYYTYDSTIYDAAGNAVTTNPVGTGGTYYHKATIFSANSTALTTATKEEKLVEIHKDTLTAEVVKYNDSTGTYYIPKDTPYRLLENLEHQPYAVEKGDKTLTNTLAYSNYPSVVLPVGEDVYHADACLGNNGLFTIKPAQGIQLSKTMEYPELGQNEQFTFAITLVNTSETLANSYPIYNYEGEYLGVAEKNADDKYIVSLKPGETVYIVDIPTGTEYTVEEILPTDSEWMINSSSGTTGTIAAYVYSEVSFENTPKVHGNLIIGKTVTHPFGNDYVMPVKEFDITVTLDGVADGTVVKVDGVDYTVTNEKLELTIKHNQVIIISEIPEGTVYTVTEKVPLGFTLQNADSYTGTISSTTNAEAALVNVYVPGEVSPVNVSHIGEKHLNGRKWQAGDTFTFELQYFNGVNWETVDGWTRTIDETTTNHQFTFNDVIQNFTFDSIGTYQFRILEQQGDIGGVAYDILEKKFEIKVVDDFSGKLIIDEVTTTTPKNGDSGVTVTENNNEYVIETHFNNVYRVSGSATVTIDITKVIGTNNTGLPFGPEGFTFEVRENGTLIDTSAATDSAGKTTVMLTFDASRVDETITYTVKEVNDGKDGVIYDPDEKTFTVEIVDNLDGTIGALVNGADEDTFYATFTNDYVLESAEIEISGSKTLNGRDLLNEEFIFNLYRCEDANFSNPDEVDSVKNIDGKFTLKDSISVAGTYYYIVDEQVSGKPGVTDDTSKYYVTVEVDKGEGDSLGYEITSVVKEDAEGNQTTVSATEIVFVNEYKPAADTFQIFSGKDLIGRQLQDGEFTFKFYSADENFENLSELQEKTNDADGQIAFDELTFETAGTYYYVIKEVPGDDIRITYDENALCITVTVTDEGGTLYAQITQLQTKKGDEAPVTVSYYVFTNKYTPKPDDITVEISADKVVKNEGTDSIGPDGFHFVLENVTAQEEFTAISDADGAIIFDAFTFTEDDIGKTYQYRLYEVNDGLANVTYSTAVYEFAITITLDDNNVLVATFTQGEETVDAIEATFENIYDYDIPVETPPVTGDSDMMLWIVMLFISGGVFTAMKASEKMKKANGR